MYFARPAIAIAKIRGYSQSTGLLTPHSMFFVNYSHNYELAFGISMLTLDKAQRLLYGDSLMTHAMVFTGLSWEVSEATKIDQFLVLK